MLPAPVFSHLVIGFCSDSRRGRWWLCLGGLSWVRMTLSCFINSSQCLQWTSQCPWAQRLGSGTSETQGRHPWAVPRLLVDTRTCDEHSKQRGTLTWVMGQFLWHPHVEEDDLAVWNSVLCHLDIVWSHLGEIRVLTESLFLWFWAVNVFYDRLS